MKAKTAVKIVLCLWGLSIIDSCTLPWPLSYGIIPGECLASTELSFLVSYERQIAQNNIQRGYYQFVFGPDFANLSEDYHRSGNWMSTTPTWSVFSEFGSNANAIKEEYYKRLENLKKPGERDSEVSTILYDGGTITLVANKDFAGHPAGENLGPYIHILTDNIAIDYDSVESVFDFPLDYQLLIPKSFAFGISTEGCEVKEESVDFTLEVPVKVVKYLHWINDKLTNPDAPLPYEEAVLHCKFVTRTCLKTIH